MHNAAWPCRLSSAADAMGHRIADISMTEAITAVASARSSIVAAELPRGSGNESEATQSEDDNAAPEHKRPRKRNRTAKPTAPVPNTSAMSSAQIAGGARLAEHAHAESSGSTSLC